jgi:thioredoxin-related protein
MQEMQMAETFKEKNVSQSQTGAKSGRNSIIWIFILGFAVFLIVSLISQSKKGTLNWSDNYGAVIQQAKTVGKPVLVVMYRDRFTQDDVKRMLEKVYVDKTVLDYVEKNFMPVLVDAEKYPDLARRYNLGLNPAHFIISPQTGDIISSLSGPHPADKFLKWLQENAPQKDKTP